MSNSSRRSAATWPSDVLCSELVQVFAGSGDHRDPSIPAIVEAISETEAVLYCEARLRRSGAILVNADSWSFRARIAGCRKDTETPGYLILAKFDEPFRWNAGAFCPKHILDLRTLAGEATGPQNYSQPAAQRVYSAGQSN